MARKLWTKVPSLVKMYTDSGAAVNLKNRVCSSMIAATIRQVQLMIVLADTTALPGWATTCCSFRLLHLPYLSTRPGQF